MKMKRKLTVFIEYPLCARHYAKHISEGILTFTTIRAYKCYYLHYIVEYENEKGSVTFQN